jgi:plastocyanin
MHRALMAAAVSGILGASVAVSGAAGAGIRASACTPVWSTGDSPNVGARSNNLLGVSALSGTDAWAVGYYLDKTTSRDATLALHWDGIAWTASLPQNIADSNNFLYDVDIRATNDVWAAGRYATQDQLDQTLVEHWNGTSWLTFTTPNSGAGNNRLFGVEARAANDVWAAGYFDDGTGLNRTLVEHYDGTGWSILPSPNAPGSSNFLWDVAASSATDAWAVGYSFNVGKNRMQTLSLHWNGTSWVKTASPNVGTGHNFLLSVAAPAPNDAWAVGYTQSDTGIAPLIEHWTGAAWSIIPNVPGGDTGYLRTISAASSTDIWMVGIVGAVTTAPSFEHWDGSVLAVTPAQSVSSTDVPNAVSAAPGGFVWTAGFANSQGTVVTRIEQLCATAVKDTGFSPSASTVAQGDGAAWAIDPQATSSHSVTDSSGMGLFDSGLRAAGGSFVFTFDAAGTYAYTDTTTGSTGSVTVPITVVPASGTTSTTFTVTAADVAAPSGFAFDIQIKRPGSSSFQQWKTGLSSPTATFVPDAGAGTYQFRSRLRNTVNGFASAYSPGQAITVTGLASWMWPVAGSLLRTG